MGGGGSPVAGCGGKDADTRSRWGSFPVVTRDIAECAMITSYAAGGA